MCKILLPSVYIFSSIFVQCWASNHLFINSTPMKYDKAIIFYVQPLKSCIESLLRKWWVIRGLDNDSAQNYSSWFCQWQIGHHGPYNTSLKKGSFLPITFESISNHRFRGIIMAPKCIFNYCFFSSPHGGRLPKK